MSNELVCLHCNVSLRGQPDNQFKPQPFPSSRLTQGHGKLRDDHKSTVLPLLSSLDCRARRDTEVEVVLKATKPAVPEPELQPGSAKLHEAQPSSTLPWPILNLSILFSVLISKMHK